MRQSVWVNKHSRSILFSSRKLHETMSAVQQLEQSMSRLRKWLAHIETELGKPVVYQRPELTDIQRCLQHTQHLQQEAEKQSTGVSSGKLEINTKEQNLVSILWL